MRTIEAKAVVLGMRTVGKTSLVVRYIGKMFNYHMSATVGAAFYSCKIEADESIVKLQLWDTAGQERFRSIIPLYYRSANAAILVFDITSWESFMDAKEWVKELHNNVKEPLVLSLVGNKSDLKERRMVSTEDAIQYAQTIDANYFETSALLNTGVDDLFLNTAVRIIQLAEEDTNTSMRIYDTVNEYSNFNCSPLRGGTQLHQDTAANKKGSCCK